MIFIEDLVFSGAQEAVKSLYGIEASAGQIQIQRTRKEFEGDITIVVFPLLKLSKKPPEATANELGEYLSTRYAELSQYNVVKGFLNITVSASYWIDFLNYLIATGDQHSISTEKDTKTVVIEYSSPNTNKPLHLGHIRNNLLGFSLSKIFQARGNKVIKTNIVNDRGIHICKSMIAWQKFANKATPASVGTKGDHFVGDYYVRFNKEYKKEIEQLATDGVDKKEAEKKAPVLVEAQELLRKWEAGDKETVRIWKMMNQWVYDGFNETYKKLGVDFDKIYYESDTYKLGKEHVIEGLEKGIFVKDPDGSVWVDLTEEGLDRKLLLRSDGTSVYMTQDIGTAKQRFDDFKFDKHIYVVGNEQDYHFKVLPLILKKLGYSWAGELFHLSYGMVELPEGRMKSREGTVVDADDLIEEMIGTARAMSLELGKLEDYSDSEREEIFRIIGLGALKYFILKVDPKKNMVFNPKESIDFNGNTGPFIQYTYARIQSVMRKGSEMSISINNENPKDLNINEKETSLIKIISQYTQVLKDSAEAMNPALIANYVYELAREYNQYYHDFTILHEAEVQLRNFRINLSQQTGQIIESAMALLGIEVPERM